MTRAPTFLFATLAVARLTRRLLVRGKLMRIAALLAALPVLLVLFATSGAPTPDDWFDFYKALTVLLVVIPALLLAPWLADEIDDRTYTYLWSRPVPRTSVLLGKFLALMPVALALCTAAVGASFLVMFRVDLSGRTDLFLASILAIGCGAAAWSAAAVGIGSAVPKHATAAVLVYFMFLDASLGSIPFSIQNVSMIHHARNIALVMAEARDGVLTSMLWLAGLSALWLGVAVWRVSTAEYTSEE